jgi:hypothetical protein
MTAELRKKQMTEKAQQNKVRPKQKYTAENGRIKSGRFSADFDFRGTKGDV